MEIGLKSAPSLLTELSMRVILYFKNGLTLGLYWILDYRLAEIPKGWSLEFQLDMTFADNFSHIYGQITDGDYWQ